VTDREPRSPLELDHAAMQALGRQVADLVAGHLATLRDQPVIATGVPPEVRRRLAAAPPEEGAAFDALLDVLRADVLPVAAREPHPGFMGYVPGAPPSGGDGRLDRHRLQPVRRRVAGGRGAERARAGGARLVPRVDRHAAGAAGCSPAAARARRSRRGGRAPRRGGDDAARLPRLTLYTSDQAHSAVQRAAWTAGVPRANVRVLPADDGFRLAPRRAARREAADRAAGLQPFLVAASAGTTNTGAVDPLDALADYCAAEALWLHADAAYGGFAVLTARGASALAGLGRCDSVALDPHKWLFVPFECGCLLARDPARLRAAFAVDPDYLRDVASGAARSTTRRPRASTSPTTASSSPGSRGRSRCGSACATSASPRCATRWTARWIWPCTPSAWCAPSRRSRCCRRRSSASSASACARPARRPGGARRAQRARERGGERGGRYLVSSTRLRGAFSLRMCVLGYRTTAADVEGCLRAVAGAAGLGGA
jgi:hypothetical protein